MQLTGRLFLVTALLVGFALAACATLPPARSIDNFRSIAGKWEGSGQSPRGMFSYTVTFHEDGTYEWTLPRSSGTGTLKMMGAEVRWASSTGRSGFVTLHEGEGKRVLKFTYDQPGWSAQAKPAK